MHMPFCPLPIAGRYEDADLICLTRRAVNTPNPAMQSGGFWRRWSRSCNGRDIDGHESGLKALPSRYCPETASPTGNLTLIVIISFSTRCAGQKAGTTHCSNNGWILLVNPKLPKIVPRICRL